MSELAQVHWKRPYEAAPLRHARAALAAQNRAAANLKAFDLGRAYLTDRLSIGSRVDPHCRS
jgi:hypothetical protein